MSEDKSYLVLGWEVKQNQEPKYWRNNSNPKAGDQQESDLVRVPADAIASHTAIIAQSGSGKSFFLGRLIEEIVLRTNSRCVILDPNADFRRIREIEDEDLWKNAAYDPPNNRFKLPHEASRKDFETLWNQVSIRVRTGGVPERHPGHEQFRFWWPSLSVEFLAEELDPMLRSELYHCHTFVQAVALLTKLKFLIDKDDSLDLIDIAEELLAKAAPDRNGPIDRASIKFVLEEKFEIEELRQNLCKDTALLSKALDFLDVEKLPPGAPKTHLQNVLNGIIDVSVANALKTVRYTSADVTQYYFGKAREYQQKGLLQTLAEAQKSIQSVVNRIEVIDLPSLPEKSARLVAINTVLTAEWERARKDWTLALKKDKKGDDRVPTFIIVDEAHNLIPQDPLSDAEVALREQFRTLVAEGRKYGLFLILVSQRPDKLDSLVVSECENHAILKLGSPSILTRTREMLGLEDVPKPQLERCLKFKKGRGLLIGRWSPELKVLYCAARRTIEGGRDLNDKHWAKAPSLPAPKS